MQRDERFDKAESVIKTGFIINIFLMTMKLAAGYWGQSNAVFADGIESACDFIAIGGTLIALKLGRKPYDPEHPYGHGRAESLSAVLVSMVIFITGGWIMVDSIKSAISMEFKPPEPVAVGAAFATIIIKEFLYRFSQKVGAELESPALLAVARDHRKDAITSIATLAGVTGAYFGLGIMDPVAAGLTSLFIIHIGWETFRSASHDLMDGSAPEGFVSCVVKLAEAVPCVEHVHEIRARRSGQYMIIDMKIEMDPEMTVKESHEVATEIKRVIFSELPNVGDVMIHIDPHDEEHEDPIRL